MVSRAVPVGPERVAKAAASEMSHLLALKLLREWPQPRATCSCSPSPGCHERMHARTLAPRQAAAHHPDWMSSHVCGAQPPSAHCLCRLKFERNDSIPLELQLVSAHDVPNLRCLRVVSSGDGNAASLRTVNMDSAYWSYQFCQCLPGLVSAPADPYVVNKLWRIRCVPEAPKSRGLNPMYVVAGVVNWGALAIIIATVVYFSRRLRPPGLPPRSSPSVTNSKYDS